jgi:dTDP-L-rhamnose 4-epimerase
MTRILITGGCGFIGRHVAQELMAHGHEVRLYDAMIDQVHGLAQAEIPEAPSSSAATCVTPTASAPR